MLHFPLYTARHLQNTGCINNNCNTATRKLTCSISDRLVGVDRLVQLSTVEEILQQLLDFWNPSRSTNQDDVVYGGLVHLGVPQSFLNWFQCSTEQIGIQFLKASSCDTRVEVDALEQRVDFD